MKKLTALFIVIAITITATAQKVLTLHSNGFITHYTGLYGFIDAYNVATHGDTIYIPGAAFYAPASFNKRLTVFGAGHSLDSTLVTGKTFITGDISFAAGASISYFEGIEFSDNVAFADNIPVNQLTFKRCKFNRLFNVPGNLSTPSTNLALLDNVFVNAVYLNNAVNTVVSNSIIQLNIGWSQSNLISNNIFLFPNPYVLHDCHNNQVMNNIFIHDYITQGTGNIFSKNLIASATPSYGTLPTLIDNYPGVPRADIFINQTGNAFNYGHNYRLQNPATYPGTDGTQIGIYGGPQASKTGWVPSNPHFQFKNIAPQTNNNGQLQIQIQVGAQNN